MKAVYISGQITGLELEKAEMKFELAEKFILGLKCAPINPMKLDHVGNNDKAIPSWEDYMMVDLRALFFSDEVMMLDNWKNSLGATIEFIIAGRMDKQITYHYPDGKDTSTISRDFREFFPDHKKFPLVEINKHIRNLYLKSVHDNNYKEMEPMFLEIMKYCRLEPTTQE